MRKTTNGKSGTPVVEAEIVSSDVALGALNRSEIDVQVATAKQYPRSMKRFRQTALELATLDEETAASMFYALPRGRKTIDGPSVRLAEIIMHAWTNLRAESDIIAIDETHLTAMGWAIDLETNIACRSRVKRRITDKNGRRYNEDMIIVTGNAASSIALRNAIFKVVPFALVRDVYAAARRTAIGDASTLRDRRAKAFSWFSNLGVTYETILKRLGRRGLEEVTLDDLELLTGLRTAIKDGDTSVEDAFKVGANEDDLNAQLEDELANKPNAQTTGPQSAMQPERER